MRHLTRASRKAIAVALLAFVSLAVPPLATAHVNRVVGPYTFFVVLIEEPFFATNRAGFEFWVHDADRPVQGLDRTLRAQASNASKRVDLVVSPMNDRGFYDVEVGSRGLPFDPGSGGAWSLRLLGTVEGLAVDESFATTFPAYPRAGPVTPAATATAPVAPPDPGPSLVAGGTAAGALGLGFVIVWHRRRRASPDGSPA